MTTFIKARAKTTAGNLLLCQNKDAKGYHIVLQSENGHEVLEQINKGNAQRSVEWTACYLFNEYCTAYQLQA